jgi:hypothetical protein
MADDRADPLSHARFDYNATREKCKATTTASAFVLRRLAEPPGRSANRR